MATKKQTPRKKPSTISKKKTTIAKKRIHKHVKQLVVPNKHNDYRPLIQRTTGIIVILVIVIVAQFIHSHFISGRVLGSNPAIATEKLLEATNAERANHSAGALTLSSSLSAAAYAKAQDMLANQYWSHNSPSGVTPWKWIADEEYNYLKAGENLARGFNSTKSILNAWMNSPSHRENVINPAYTEVGFAVVDGEFHNKPTTLVVALYAQPSTLAAVVTPPSTNDTIALGQTEESPSFATRLARGLESAAPALIFTLILLGVAFVVTTIAHRYRKKLPKDLRRTWYRHHAAIKGVFIALIAIIAIFSYGSGII